MIWMKGIKNGARSSYYVVNSESMANYGTSNDSYPDETKPYATGLYDVRNIYDIAGNVAEQTVEANSTDNRCVRGGDYSITGAAEISASNRSNILPNAENTNVGTRITLY